MNWETQEIRDIVFGSIIKVRGELYIFLDCSRTGNSAYVIDLNDSYRFEKKIISADFAAVLQLQKAHPNIHSTSVLSLIQTLFK